MRTLDFNELDEDFFRRGELVTEPEPGFDDLDEPRPARTGSGPGRRVLGLIGGGCLLLMVLGLAIPNEPASGAVVDEPLPVEVAPPVPVPIPAAAPAVTPAARPMVTPVAPVVTPFAPAKASRPVVKKAAARPAMKRVKQAPTAKKAKAAARKPAAKKPARKPARKQPVVWPFRR